MIRCSEEQVSSKTQTVVSTLTSLRHFWYVTDRALVEGVKCPLFHTQPLDCFEGTSRALYNFHILLNVNTRCALTHSKNCLVQKHGTHLESLSLLKLICRLAYHSWYFGSYPVWVVVNSGWFDLDVNVSRVDILEGEFCREATVVLCSSAAGHCSETLAHNDTLLVISRDLGRSHTS